jgi:2'-5' RNA ligase
MKVAFALLPGRDVQNRVNRLAWSIHQRWNTGTRPRAIPPHVSLKQPFEVEDGAEFAAIDRYLAGLAAEVRPVELVLRGILLWETVFAVDVEPSATLLGLHARLNADLARIVRNPGAPFDGAGYHFHLTVATGGANADAYREIYLAHRDIEFTGPATASELAKFVYDTRPGPGALQYMTHTVLALGGAAPSRN